MPATTREPLNDEHGIRTTTRTRPEPAGEPAPTTVDPSPTPVEDAPEQPDPEPSPMRTHYPDGEPIDLNAIDLDRLRQRPDMSHAPLSDRLPTDDLRDDHPLSVWEAVAEVTRQIKAIAKDKRTEGGERYNFRGIDDALEALHPILGDVGLVLLPGEVVERERETRQTAKGGTLNVCHLRVRYMMVGPDGSSMTGEAWGEAGDSGDKATQKAASQSYKTFVFQTFSIPTRDSARDEPDAVTEESHPFTAEQRNRAAAAWSAALDAATYDRLAQIRAAALAEELLGAPVDPAGGRPLGVLFDERRAQIESAPIAGQS